MNEEPSKTTATHSRGLGALVGELQALADLVLDFSFKRYVTPRLVRLLYALSLVAASLSALTWMFSGFSQGMLPGLFTLITGPIAFILYVLCARVAVELILAIFRIAEKLDPPESDEKRP